MRETKGLVIVTGSDINGPTASALKHAGSGSGAGRLLGKGF